MELSERLTALRMRTGMNKKQFAEYFKIPYRTYQDWELGSRTMPEYLLRLMAYKVGMEGLNKGERYMNRLINIEGLPGIGKTTFAKMIQQKAAAFSDDVHLYIEGDLHPADMAWCALLTAEEYKDLCVRYQEYVELFEQNKQEWNEYTILAYSKIGNLSEELTSYFEQKEIYDGRVGNEMFCRLQKERWAQFGREAEGITIFECALLQNQVNELMLFQEADEEAIFNHIEELIRSTADLRPMVIYLDAGPEASLKRAAGERVDSSGNRVWEEGTAKYVSASPYGIRHNLSGVSGMYRYFAERRQLELRLLKRLSAEVYTVPVHMEDQHDISEQAAQKICDMLH